MADREEVEFLAAAKVVREAAVEDSKASIETWGPKAFARRVRTKLHSYRVPLPPWFEPGQRPPPASKRIPSGVNVILLGPTGSGKSSLIYTWWRALSGSVSSKDDFLSSTVNESLLQRLRVGWTAEDAQQSHSDSATGAAAGGAAAGAARARPQSLLAAAPRHGTTALAAFELQAPDPTVGTGGIVVHDTRGQQFFTVDEERFAEQLLEGRLRPGSTAESKAYRYWFMLGQFGFISATHLATAPHVLVLVFDVTLRSFHAMLEEGHQNELCKCYRRILARARQQGHEVFAVLTHVDVYVPEEPDSDEEEGGGGSNAAGGVPGEAFDRDADMPGIVAAWREQLSRALAEPPHPGISPDHVYAVDNYHVDSSAHDPVRDLAALECLEHLTEAGSRYITARYADQQGCTLS